MRKKRIVVGIAGASGVIYGVRMLEVLRETDFETHLIISEAGKRNIEIETSHKAKEVEALADHVYDNQDVGAALASGSFLTEGMVVIPVHNKDPLGDRQFLYRQSLGQGRGCHPKGKTEAGVGGAGDTPPQGTPPAHDHGRGYGGTYPASHPLFLSYAKDH